MDFDNVVDINSAYTEEFENYLTKSDVSYRTLAKHVNNINLFLNEYLVYYEGNTADTGISNVFYFLRYWYMEKCAFASETGLKSLFASIKKFYKYMMEYNYISRESYTALCEMLRNNTELIIKEFRKYEAKLYSLDW